MAKNTPKKDDITPEEMQDEADKVVQGESMHDSEVADMFEDSTQGEVFGGNYPPIHLDADQVSPMLRYEKDTKIPLEDKQTKEIKLKTVAIAKVLSTGKLVGLPISAIFEKNFKEANICIGDEFAIKRYGDVIKKGSKTATNPHGISMQVHAVKVFKRSEPVEK